MIPIKFRAWHIHEKYWLEDFRLIIDGKTVIIDDGESYIVCSEGEPSQYSPIALSQYTSLNDKNGKEIYEGDVVNFAVENEISAGYIGGKPGIIEFDINRCCYVINTIKNKLVTINHGYDAYSGSLEIIGNIYDNPDLLSS